MTPTQAVSIPCPSCGVGQITLLPAQLLTGSSFSCGSCAASVTLQAQSRETVKQGLEGFERLEALARR